MGYQDRREPPGSSVANADMPLRRFRRPGIHSYSPMYDICSLQSPRAPYRHLGVAGGKIKYKAQK